MAKPGPKQLLVFLQPLKAGDIVTESDLLRNVPAWKKSTLDTYRKKNKLDPLLTSLPSGGYRVVRDGKGLREADINAALSQVATPKMVLRRGDVVEGERDSYRLDQELGEGAVGLVWRAKTVSSGSKVAVKVCAPRDDLLARSVLPNVLDRFRRESKLGPKLRHDALVRYVDFGSMAKGPFLVMELAQGSLGDVLRAHGRLAPEEVLGIMARVCAGLSHLHSANCVHRDIKPDNVLRTGRGYVLGDLGIVQWGDLNRNFTGAGTITKASVRLGSFSYMPPEQVSNPHLVGPASDVYSLAVTCMELLLGDVPSPHTVAASRVDFGELDPRIGALLARMSAYDIKDRPSLPEIQAEIEQLRGRKNRGVGA